MPKNFMRPCLLLLLGEHPAHGYDLLDRLHRFGFGKEDPGRIYRALRGLEAEGLVESTWESSSAGPHRRTYVLTEAGSRALHDEAVAVAATQTTLDDFLCRCSEVVPITVPVGPYEVC